MQKFQIWIWGTFYTELIYTSVWQVGPVDPLVSDWRKEEKGVDLFGRQGDRTRGSSAWSRARTGRAVLWILSNYRSKATRRATARLSEFDTKVQTKVQRSTATGSGAGDDHPGAARLLCAGCVCDLQVACVRVQGSRIITGSSSSWCSAVARGGRNGDGTRRPRPEQGESERGGQRRRWCSPKAGEA